METRNVIFVVGLLAAAGLLFWVITESVDQSVYMMGVHEAVAKQEQFAGQEIKVQGNVMPGTILCEEGRDRCRFELTKGGEQVTVFYEGPRPDTFRDCADVIVTGRLDDGRMFQAVDLIAKCPSKYDELPGGCEQPEDVNASAEGQQPKSPAQPAY